MEGPIYRTDLDHKKYYMHTWDFAFFCFWLPPKDFIENPFEEKTICN